MIIFSFRTKLIYQGNWICENLWIGGKAIKAARMSLATFRLGRTGAHNLGFLKIFKNIEQPTRYNWRYSIKTNSIKKSSLFKNDKANIKVGRAYFYPHPQIHKFGQIQWRSEKWSTQNSFKNKSIRINELNPWLQTSNSLNINTTFSFTTEIQELVCVWIKKRNIYLPNEIELTEAKLGDKQQIDKNCCPYQSPDGRDLPVFQSDRRKTARSKKQDTLDQIVPLTS